MLSKRTDFIGVEMSVADSVFEVQPPLRIPLPNALDLLGLLLNAQPKVPDDLSDDEPSSVTVRIPTEYKHLRIQSAGGVEA